MKVAYIRVSTTEQSTARQEEALKEYGIEKYFIEKVSGKTMDRPELKKCLEFCRSGDTLYCLDFSRLARGLKQLISITELLASKNVTLISIKENIDTSNAQGRLVLSLFGCVYQFELENLKERQAMGIAIAKAQGKYKGRKPIEVSDFGQYYEEYMSRKVNKGQLAKKLKISRPTLDKLLKEYEKTHATTEKTAI